MNYTEEQKLYIARLPPYVVESVNKEVAKLPDHKFTEDEMIWLYQMANIIITCMTIEAIGKEYVKERRNNHGKN